MLYSVGERFHNIYRTHCHYCFVFVFLCVENGEGSGTGSRGGGGGDESVDAGPNLRSGSVRGRGGKSRGSGRQPVKKSSAGKYFPPTCENHISYN